LFRERTLEAGAAGISAVEEDVEEERIALGQVVTRRGGEDKFVGADQLGRPRLRVRLRAKCGAARVSANAIAGLADLHQQGVDLHSGRQVKANGERADGRAVPYGQPIADPGYAEVGGVHPAVKVVEELLARLQCPAVPGAAEWNVTGKCQC